MAAAAAVAAAATPKPTPPDVPAAVLVAAPAEAPPALVLCPAAAPLEAPSGAFGACGAFCAKPAAANASAETKTATLDPLCIALPPKNTPCNGILSPLSGSGSASKRG